MSSEVVPFGKYKGKPVEVLLADSSYCDWIASQPGFRERYPTINTLIINHGGEPSDTPEHNGMQAAFLDDALCLRLAALVIGGDDGEYITTPEAISDRRFEAGGWDVRYEVSAHYVEKEGVLSTSQGWRVRYYFHVELKPDLGDDFPAVLRQIKRYKCVDSGGFTCACVVVRRHEFQGVTWAQVREMYGASGVSLVQESEIREAP